MKGYSSYKAWVCVIWLPVSAPFSSELGGPPQDLIPFECVWGRGKSLQGRRWTSAYVPFDISELLQRWDHSWKFSNNSSGADMVGQAAETFTETFARPMHQSSFNWFFSFASSVSLTRKSSLPVRESSSISSSHFRQSFFRNQRRNRRNSLSGRESTAVSRSSTFNISFTFPGFHWFPYPNIARNHAGGKGIGGGYQMKVWTLIRWIKRLPR